MKLTFRNCHRSGSCTRSKHDPLRDGPVMRVMSRRLVTVATAVTAPARRCLHKLAHGISNHDDSAAQAATRC